MSANESESTYDMPGSTMLDHGCPMRAARIQVGAAYPDDASETLVALTFFDDVGVSMTFALSTPEARVLSHKLRRESDLIIAREFALLKDSDA